MKAESQACKFAAAAVAALVLLLLVPAVDGQLQAGSDAVVIGGAECSVVGRSRTFEGDCAGSKAACVDACRHESYAEGTCFIDLADPVCLCTKPCPPSSV